VLALRQIRGDNALPPGKLIDANLVCAATVDAALRGSLTAESATIGRLARATVRVVDAGSANGGPAAHAVISGGIDVSVPLAGLIDVEKECARLRDEVAGLAKQISSREQRLGNAKYVERAPPEVVAGDRAILEEMKTKRDQLADKVRALCGA
jgi:valyl-tRNA synthetase